MFERTITSAVVAFLLVVVGGVTTLGWTWWWQERTGCDQRWETAIGKANGWWEARLKEETEALLDADTKGLVALGEAMVLRKENEKLLAEQRKEIPLSDPCTQCRVPWEWIWVRKDRAGGVGKGS